MKGDCEGSSSGSLEVVVTSANGPIEIYVIAPLIGPFPATVGSPVLITDLTGAPGPGRTYIVAVSDDDGPSSSNVQILSYANALTGTVASVTHNSDCVVSNGAIDITPSGGSGVYTYRWVEMSDPLTTIEPRKMLPVFLEEIIALRLVMSTAIVRKTFQLLPSIIRPQLCLILPRRRFQFVRGLT